MFSRRSRRLALAAYTALTATVLQFGSCGITDVGRFFARFNPCGSILTCDPATYEFVRSGYEGPGVDTSVNVFCTFPPYCDDTPIYAPARQP